MNEDPELLALSTIGGGLLPLAVRRYYPAKASLTGVDEIRDVFTEPGVDIGLLLGAPSLGLAIAGARNSGPLKRNTDAIYTAAAFGSGAIASALGILMYSAQDVSREANLSLVPTSQLASARQATEGTEQLAEETGMGMQSM